MDSIIKIIAICLLLLLSVYCDIRSYKIKNVITLPFILAGLLTGLFIEGANGLSHSVLGILLPLAILLPLYILRMLGAGDIKLLCAIGAITGPGTILYVIAYSFISGGIIGLVVMLVRKNLGLRIQYLITYLKSCFLTVSMLPYGNPHSKNDGSKFRFSYAIACGTFISLFFL